MSGTDDFSTWFTKNAMAAHGVELIVLSGYLRQLGPRTLMR